MPDNLEDRGPEDGRSISLSEPWEVTYWCKRNECTEPELIEAVHAMGNKPEDVANYFLHLREGSEGSDGENGVGEE